MIHKSITAVIMAAASLTRPLNTLLSLLQAGNNAMARMIPQTTGEIKGLNILKHRAIKRAITPIRIAMSIAGPMYVFSPVILPGSFIRIPLLEVVRLWLGLSKRYFYKDEKNLLLMFKCFSGGAAEIGRCRQSFFLGLLPRFLMSSTVASFTFVVRLPAVVLQEKIQREMTPRTMSRNRKDEFVKNWNFEFSSL
jgi:hypothetical protein